MRVRFLEEARDELFDQIAYYEERQRGLGGRFREAVEAAVLLAVTHPSIGSRGRKGTRRVFVSGFPFAVVYRVEPTELVVFAVAHFRRKPTYWSTRG